MRLTSLQDYEQVPRSGRTTLLPLAILAPRMKAIADAQATTAPTAFLSYLQQAMHSSPTQPLSASDQRLSQAFDRSFAAANRAAAGGDYGPISNITQATHDAHELIVDHCCPT
jgi:hypothetical protein